MTNYTEPYTYMQRSLTTTLTLRDLVNSGLGDEQVEFLVTVDGHRAFDPSIIVSHKTADKALQRLWIRTLVEPRTVVDERLRLLEGYGA